MTPTTNINSLNFTEKYSTISQEKETDSQEKETDLMNMSLSGSSNESRSEIEEIEGTTLLLPNQDLTSHGKINLYESSNLGTNIADIKELFEKKVASREYSDAHDIYNKSINAYRESVYHIQPHNLNKEGVKMGLSILRTINSLFLSLITKCTSENFNDDLKNEADDLVRRDKSLGLEAMMTILDNMIKLDMDENVLHWAQRIKEAMGIYYYNDNKDYNRYYPDLTSSSLLQRCEKNSLSKTWNYLNNLREDPADETYVYELEQHMKNFASLK